MGGNEVSLPGCSSDLKCIISETRFDTFSEEWICAFSVWCWPCLPYSDVERGQMPYQRDLCNAWSMSGQKSLHPRMHIAIAMRRWRKQEANDRRPITYGAWCAKTSLSLLTNQSQAAGPSLQFCGAGRAVLGLFVYWGLRARRLLRSLCAHNSR